MAQELITFPVKDTDAGEWTLLKVFALLAPHTQDFTWSGNKLDFAESPAARRAAVLESGMHRTSDVFTALALDPQLLEGLLRGTGPDNTVIEIKAIRGDNWDISAPQTVTETVRTIVRGAENIDPGSAQA